MAAIRLRIEEKAIGYAVQPHETLSLLLVGSLPLIGAVTATYVYAPFVTPDRLNAALNESLIDSRFERVYLQLVLSGNGVWGWTRQSGWTVLRAPENVGADHLVALLQAELLPRCLLGLQTTVTRSQIRQAVKRAVAVFLTAYAA